LIKKLENGGYTYVTGDGVYFDTSKFSEYGKLSRKRIDELEAGKRIDLKDKKNITDFALWKFSGPEEKRQQEWKSPWGTGFPGWHIECSAMSSKYLGEHFDIHTGGEDHIPIHHENEIAQSECGFGVDKWVNYWMHVAFLNLRGGKMSKSSGKIKTIGQLETEGISPMAYKYFNYTAHYRKPLTWSEESIEGAVNSYKKLKNEISNLKNTSSINKKYLKEFEARIDDDLDMPGALAVLWELVRDENADGKIGTIKKMDEVFGLKLLESEEKNKTPEEILEIARNRQKAREEKNWKKSDELRDLIKTKGWIVKDTKEGFELEEK
jgi:cysteinyl-tRNA synthetase